MLWGRKCFLLPGLITAIFGGNRAEKFPDQPENYADAMGITPIKLSTISPTDAESAIGYGACGLIRGLGGIAAGIGQGVLRPAWGFFPAFLFHDLLWPARTARVLPRKEKPAPVSSAGSAI
jgi:hypothetical protein